MAKRLAAVKPVRSIPLMSGALNVLPSDWEQPMVAMTLARYRADQRLIRAVREWRKNLYYWKNVDALLAALAAHNRAVNPQEKP